MQRKLKLLSIILISIVGLGAGKGAQAQTLRAITVEGEPGKVAPVRIELVNVAGLKELKFSLYYAARLPDVAPMLKLPETRLAPGPFWGEGTHHEIRENWPGNLEARFVAPDGRATNGSGTVLTIPFPVPEKTPGGTVHFMQLLSVTATGEGGAPLKLKVERGDLNVRYVEVPRPVLALEGRNGELNGRPGRSVYLDLRATGQLQGLKAVRMKLRYPPSLRFRREAVDSGGMVNREIEVELTGPGEAVLTQSLNPRNGHLGLGIFLPFYLPPETPAGSALPISITDVEFTDVTSKVIPVSVPPVTVTLDDPPAPLPGRVTVGSGRGYRGDVVKIPVTADAGIADVRDLSFRIPFGPGGDVVVPYASFGETFDPGTFFGGAAGSISFVSRAEFSIRLWNSEATGNGPAPILTLNVEIPDKTPTRTVYPLRLEDLSFTVAGEDRTSAFTAGYVEVLCRREKGHVLRPGGSESPVEVGDAVLTLRHLVGMTPITEEQAWSADLDGDGAVTVADVTGILKAVAGLEVPPCAD